jgi:hypothetical protein
MIVFCDMSAGAAVTAHPWAPYWFWFRMADNAEGLAGLGFRQKLSFYTSAILGMPRNLLGLLRDNLPAIPSIDISVPNIPHQLNPALRLGSRVLRLNLDRPFRSYTPRTSARPADVCVYSEATKADFHFGGGQIWPVQAAFARKFAALARSHQVKLVYLHLPITQEIKSSRIDEPACWPDVLQGNAVMMGITPAKLYAGMTEENILDLFYNFEHLNQNGQEYFTSIITPRLVQIYEDQTKP